MFEENDDVENNQNDEDYSDNEEISDLNLEDDEMTKEDNTFKLVTYKNILDDMQKKTKTTFPYLTKFEKARIMGVRLQQLANGAKPRIDVTGLRSMNEILNQELIQRKIPFIIRRTLPNGKYEDWKLEDFESI